MLPGKLARPRKRRKRTRRKFNVPQRDAVACAWDSRSESEVACDKGPGKIRQNPKSGSKRVLVKRDGQGVKRLPRKDLRNRDILK